MNRRLTFALAVCFIAIAILTIGPFGPIDSLDGNEPDEGNSPGAEVQAEKEPSDGVDEGVRVSVGSAGEGPETGEILPEVHPVLIRAQDELGRVVLTFEVELGIREQVQHLPSNEQGEVVANFPASDTASTTFFIIRSDGFVPLIYKFQGGVGHLEEVSVLLLTSCSVTVAGTSLEGSLARFGSVALRPEFSSQDLPRLDVEGAEIFPFMSTVENFGYDGKAEFSGLFPGEYWLTVATEGAWSHEEGRVVSIGEPWSELEFVVNPWAESEHASGVIQWPMGPENWEYNLSIVDSSGEVRGRVWGEPDASYFFVEGAPDTREEFSVMHRGSKEPVGSISVRIGEHDSEPIRLGVDQ